eukprot:CAMPEP_0194065320 /NCGR_PEP_ID=MMETSP0009_2-20130614/85392_1 /TAXON_ID=210454 /ORGANISM="Grammatophora oceanica, Strain CCMP 410" /LENGTH=746 /DNA_ID=CAMNT_0038718135 /DNA_START=89 /DNA_END=2329 /DNA_ORIENTATION=-
MKNTEFARVETRAQVGSFQTSVTIVAQQSSETESIVTRPSVDSTEASTLETMCRSDDGSSSMDEWCQQSIQVAIRLRPLNDREKASGRSPMKRSPSFRKIRSEENPLSWKVLEHEGGAALYQNGSRRIDGKTIFQFDQVFGIDSDTEGLYDGVVRPIAKAVVNGQHGTVFAYGQTGSGKTFTMQGDRAEAADGIIQMAALDLFRMIKASPDREFLVRISYMEIYNEKVRDLLGVPSGESSELPSVKVREDAHQGLHINCREVVVEDSITLLAFLEQGNHNRACAATDMNKQSSRSHAIFRVTVESRDAGDNNETLVRRATLNLVDLAGSENGKTTTGQRQKEGSKINKSLLSLSQVVHSLSLPTKKRPKYINYRDSKLTRILQPHLSGNALIAVLCCVSPAKLHTEETRSTLRFAARAKLVQTKPMVNEVVDSNHMIKQLQKQLSATRHALEDMKQRGDEAEKESERAYGELEKLKQVVYGSNEESAFVSGVELATSSRKRLRSTRSPGVAVVSDGSGSTDADTSVDYEEQEEVPGVETDDQHSISLDKPEDYDPLLGGSTHTPSTALDEEQSVCDGKPQADEFNDLAPRQLYAERELVASHPNHIEKTTLPAEVTILSDNDTLGVSRRSELTPAMVSAEIEARERFLMGRLEETEDLAESLMKDVSAARHCVRQLVVKNASLSTSVARLKKKVGAVEVKRDKLHHQQYMVLKYSVYLSLFFFFFNCQEVFLACAMFLWLTLEVVT